MNGQGGSYVIKEDQTVELAERGGTQSLVNGRVEDDAQRAAAEAAAAQAQPTQDDKPADAPAPRARRVLAAPPVADASSGN